jgi:hypothetical protein
VIGWFRRGGCRSHQAALVEFATHRAGGPDVRRALDHVDRCRACEADLAATALVLHALHRLHEETSQVEPAPGGWTRMQARLATTRTRREPSLLMSSLPGVALAVMLVIAVADLPALRGTQVIPDDGSVIVLRHTSIDDARTVARGPEAHPAVRVVARPTLRAQDRARPPALVAGPQAVDAQTTGVEPAIAVPAVAPRDAPSTDAQMTWR